MFRSQKWLALNTGNYLHSRYKIHVIPNFHQNERQDTKQNKQKWVRYVHVYFDIGIVYWCWMPDDGRQVMAIVHLDLWSRWTKKWINSKPFRLSKQILDPPRIHHTLQLDYKSVNVRKGWVKLREISFTKNLKNY
jgi:hypothetical protein